MQRRTTHRGITVLALAGALALAGVRPAAAGQAGIFGRGMHWLAVLWGAPQRAGAPAASGSFQAFWDAILQTDKGLGVDPNGEILPPPPGP